MEREEADAVCSETQTEDVEERSLIDQTVGLGLRTGSKGKMDKQL